MDNRATAKKKQKKTFVQRDGPGTGMYKVEVSVYVTDVITTLKVQYYSS